MTYLNNDTLKDPVYQVTTHTKISGLIKHQGVRITLDGSTLAYTPNAQAQNVVYEISFSAQRVNDWTFQTIVLQESTDGGTTWNDLGNRTLSAFGVSYSTAQTYRWYHHLRYVIPAYSGTRLYRLSIGSYKSGQLCTYHALDSWDGASTSTKFTNTTLIMHSVL